MRESLAKYAHEAWTGWMNYMFEKSTINEDGTVTIPKWAVDRWKRQANTKYDDLTDGEQESDRQEADRMIEIMKGSAKRDKEIKDSIKDIDPEFREVINEEFWNIL